MLNRTTHHTGWTDAVVSINSWINFCLKKKIKKLIKLSYQYNEIRKHYSENNWCPKRESAPMDVNNNI
jgi:hypothetical protein